MPVDDLVSAVGQRAAHADGLVEPFGSHRVRERPQLLRVEPLAQSVTRFADQA